MPDVDGKTKMTPTQKALLIIARKCDFTASEFAEWMWPDSPGWARVTRCGRGSHRGKGMWLAAGSFLRALEIRGLIWRMRCMVSHGRTGLTDAGRKLIEGLE